MAIPWWFELLVLSPFIVAVLACIFIYLILLRSAVKRIEPEYRQLKPDWVWLLLLPGFNILLHLYIVLRLGASYRLQIRSRGHSLKERPFDIVLGVILFVINAGTLLLNVVSHSLPDWNADGYEMIGMVIFCPLFSIMPFLIVGHLCEILQLQRYLE